MGRQEQPVTAVNTWRTWHAARITAGPGSGRLGFLIGHCRDGCTAPHGSPTVRFLQAGGGPIYTCLPLSHLEPVPTRHGGTTCPGIGCTDGEPL
jgi:hypothetical protein